MNEILATTLHGAGKPTETISFPDGTTLLILPYGGRILGLYGPRSDENFFWTHAALESVESARAFYSSNEWHNSGGDRTWLAPEADTGFPDFPDMTRYVVPRPVDPGDFQLARTGTSLTLVNRLSVTLSRPRQTLDLRITKSAAPALNPLRYERHLNWQGDVEYAGYTLHTSLEILGGGAAPSARVGLWNLLGLPHAGDLLVPTHSKSAPRVLFGEIAPADLAANEHLIRYKMRGTGISKIGIRAVATTGRVGYVHATGDRWALVIRNFFVDPSGEYIDVPFDKTEDFGYAVQACDINNQLGRYSELESHFPAIGGDTGRRSCEDIAQVWAFRGSRQDILTVACSLLFSTTGSLE